MSLAVPLRQRGSINPLFSFAASAVPGRGLRPMEARANNRKKAPNRPTRNYRVEYMHDGQIFATVVEAESSEAAIRRFNADNPRVRAVNAY